MHTGSVANPDPWNPYNFPGSGSVSKVGLDPESGLKNSENRKVYFFNLI